VRVIETTACRLPHLQTQGELQVLKGVAPTSSAATMAGMEA